MNALTRRKFISQLASAAVAGTLVNSLRGAEGAPQQRKRNVLFLMADDMRVELGCYGAPARAKTPHLDRLAQSGVRFDRAYCQFPLCNPSRTSIMTGRYPVSTGVLGNRSGFRPTHPDWVSLPQLFRENGYVTAVTGKILHAGYDDPKAWSVGSSAATEDRSDGGGRTLILPRVQTPPAPTDVLSPLPQDVAQASVSDRVVALDGSGEHHPDYKTADEAIGLLQQFAGKSEPFFLACGFRKPHSPLCAPDSFLDLYDPGTIALPPDFAPWPAVPDGFPSAAIRKRNADLFIGRPAGTAEAREVIRGYLAATSWTDWNVGRVLETLDQLNLRANTIVVFVSDHGYQLGEKGKWSKAGSLFEGSTRVPLLIAAPRADGNGQACERIVQSVDLYPTLAELCGLARPEGLEGSSLAALLDQPQRTWDQPAYSVWSENGTSLHGVAVRIERWRYAEFGFEGENGAMLLDEQVDPHELRNLANDPQHASVRQELATLARAHAKRTRAISHAATR